jgi:hypothetical protein
VDLRQRKHCPVPSYIRHVYISTWYTWALAVTAGVWSLPRCVIMVLVGNIGILVNMRRIYRLVWQNFPIHLLPNLNIAVIVRELLQLPILVISVPAAVEPPGKRVPVQGVFRLYWQRYAPRGLTAASPQPCPGHQDPSRSHLTPYQPKSARPPKPGSARTAPPSRRPGPLASESKHNTMPRNRGIEQPALAKTVKSECSMSDVAARLMA